FRVLDDYDWMLFKSSPELEKEILSGTAMPVRSNNSRHNPNARSVTGLKEGFSNLYTTPGPNPAFSKAVDAVKGERYYLVLDNIYEKGQGFKLQVDLKPTFRGPYRTVEGHVRDRSTKLPLKTEVIFEDDSTSFLITKTNTDASGYYKVLLPANRPVNGTASHPNYLLGTEDFKVTAEKLTIDFNLDSIRTGNKVIMYNIHFEPNRDIILAQSSAELERLVTFLRREKEWNIKIIGHSNNNVFADASYLQKLSFNRAVSVKRYLVNNGIPASKISCTGMGGKLPLIETKDPEEGLKNLRVEIVLEKKS
ncbi:MAG TPA: OmpA family protein, partial [Sphingobacteriaceae bacterium]